MKKNTLKFTFFLILGLLVFSINAQTTYYEDFRYENEGRGFTVQKVALDGQVAGDVGKRVGDIVDASDSSPVFDVSSRPATRIPQGGVREQRAISFKNISGSTPSFVNHEIEAWALMTNQDLSTINEQTVSFWTQQRSVVGGGSTLTVWVSENYTHGALPNTAIWTNETANIVGGIATSDILNNTYVKGNLDLSSYNSSSVTVAFKVTTDNSAYNSGVNQHGTFYISDVKFDVTPQDVATGDFSALNTSSTGQTNIFNTPSASIDNNNFSNNTNAWANVLTTTNSTPRLANGVLIPVDEGYKFEVSAAYNPVVVTEVRFIESNGHNTKGAPGNSMWKVQGSIDDTNWDDLSSPVEMVSSVHQVETSVSLTTSQSYRYYRFVLATAWTPNQLYTSLNQLDFTVGSLPNNWTGATDSDWSKASNWSKGTVPTTEDVSIPSGLTNYPTATSAVTVNSLTIESGASFIAESTVTGNVTLESVSNSYSSLIADGTVSGTVNYNRYTNAIGSVGTGGNDLISSPLGGETFDDAFVTSNSNLTENPSDSGEFAFAPFNTSTGLYDNFDLDINNDGTNTESFNLVSGIGYRAATSSGGTVSFTGTIHNSDVLGVSISAVGDAWNLIGNPYPSYIDFDTFFTVNKAEFDTASAFQAIYGYDGSAGGWTVWNQATIDDGTITELIAPGQGFFVKAKSGGGLVDFTKAMRTTGSSDDFVNGRQINGNVVLSKLNLSSASSHALTNIYFIDGTTRGLDSGYDAGSYLGDAGDFSIFTNLVENNTGLDIAIQSLPYNDFNDVVVPLGIKAEADVELNIGIDALSSVPSNINIYLEDNVLNTFILLNNGDYTFTPTIALNGSGRFFVHYSATTLSIDDQDIKGLQIYSTVNPKTISIKGQLTDITNAEVFDLQGRLVLIKELNKYNNLNKIDVSTISTGIYVVKLNNSNQSKTQKIIIK